MNKDKLKIEWLDKKDRHSMYGKYALMELACHGGIDFFKIAPSNFDQSILPMKRQKDLRPSQSFFIAKKGNSKCKVILDCSESFRYLSPAITKADLYFCSSYNKDLFENHIFLKPYSWQKEYDLSRYREKYDELNKKFGYSFNTIVPFIPLPMVMDIPARLFSRLEQTFIVYLILARNITKKYQCCI